MLDAQAVVDTAVGQVGVDARSPGKAGLFNLLGGNAGDLGGLLGRPLLQVGGPKVPHGAGGVRGTVLKGDFELAVECRVDHRVEVGEVGNPTLGLGGVGTLAGGVLLAALGLGGPGLALPVGVFGVGLPVGPALAQLVPDQVALGVTVAFDLPVDHRGVDVSLGEQAALVLEGTASLLVGTGVAAGLHVGHHDERGVGPALEELVVGQVVLEDDMAPAQGQGGVGAGAQVQPVIGLGAEVGLARVDRDVGVGLGGHVDGHAGRVVVVGLRLLGGPLHKDGGVGVDVAPRPGLYVVKGAGKVARALADLVGGHNVGRAKELGAHAGVRLHAPLAAGAAPAEQRLGAVLLADLHDVVGDGLVGLFPTDAHPAGIVGALGVGALKRVAQAVGVIGGLQRRLTLGAVAALGGKARLVALGADDAAVLDVDPHAALGLAAAAAARADLLDALFGGGRLLGGLGSKRHTLGADAHRSRSRRGGHQLGERAT